MPFHLFKIIKLLFSSFNSANQNELIKVAKEIGVDAVKFQVKNIEQSFSKELLDSPYTNENSFGKTYREHKQSLEFSKEELMEIYNFSKKYLASQAIFKFISIFFLFNSFFSKNFFL